ncbi:MAG: hypothetical protein KAS32_27570 [Candidatus Peribacteraceae bacterium]|nr:hypothetical protein [Candidatus Peribacteraceae bacterium]
MAINNPVVKHIIRAFEREHGLEPGQATGGKMNAKKSLTWFRKWVRKSYSSLRTSQVMRDKKAIRAGPMPGDFYFYVYDPKWKETLSYYDKFPLTLVLDVDAKGWLGLNFHYLPPVMRVLFLSELLKFRTEKRYRRNTKIRVSWDRIKTLANSRAAKHAIKRYLHDHVRSKFIKVPSEIYGIAVQLPVERFEKASKKKVWGDM